MLIASSVVAVAVAVAVAVDVAVVADVVVTVGHPGAHPVAESRPAAVAPLDIQPEPSDTPPDIHLGTHRPRPDIHPCCIPLPVGPDIPDTQWSDIQRPPAAADIHRMSCRMN